MDSGARGASCGTRITRQVFEKAYQIHAVRFLKPPAPLPRVELVDIFSRSRAGSHNRSPIGTALEMNASGLVRSIGAHLSNPQQVWGNHPQCHSGSHAGASRGRWKRLHTPYAANLGLKWRNCAGFGRWQLLKQK